MTPGAYTRDKASRLLVEGKVVVYCGEDRIAARVEGDHGEYLLFREPDRWRCTCPARVPCAHIEPVERVTE